MAKSSLRFSSRSHGSFTFSSSLRQGFVVGGSDRYWFLMSGGGHEIRCMRTVPDGSACTVLSPSVRICCSAVVIPSFNNGESLDGDGCGGRAAFVSPVSLWQGVLWRFVVCVAGRRRVLSEFAFSGEQVVAFSCRSPSSWASLGPIMGDLLESFAWALV